MVGKGMASEIAEKMVLQVKLRPRRLKPSPLKAAGFPEFLRTFATVPLRINNKDAGFRT
jgi:hypothetical protein